MTVKLKIEKLIKTLCTYACVFLFSCGSNPSSKKLHGKGTANDQSISLSAFNEFPPEIDGCSCYFSKNESDFKAGKYIYVNDFAKTSFVKINGKLIRFSQLYNAIKTPDLIWKEK